MCLIIDANMAHKFGIPPHDDVLPVISTLLNPRTMARVCIGGKLRTELLQSGQPMRNLLATLNRAGRVYYVADDRVAIEEEQVRLLAKQHKISKMDDAHIIALARSSGVRR